MSKGKWKILMLGGVILGAGLLAFPGHTAFIGFIYPPEKDVHITRSFDPVDFSSVGDGSAITVTVDVTNNENSSLRGFYCSDQVPNGWEVDTVSVSVAGSSIADYAYDQGDADDIYSGLTPHRWALEVPQGEGVFSPTHPIPASGGTAQVIYRMIVSDGSGSDYSVDHDAWAGWLATSPTGTGVFGYQVVVETLQADFTAEPRSGLAPLTVAFTDASTGGPSAWAWDFGDGSAVSFQQHPTYTYDVPGSYTVTLTVTRTEPVSSTTIARPNFITVTRPPLQADFEAEPRSGLAPLMVAFTDASTGGPSAWAWDFGDGSAVSFQQHPTYTYDGPGNYTVTLTVTRTEPVSSTTIARPNFITVTRPPLQADFEAEPRSGLVPLTVTFTDTSTGDVLTRTWDFGDGGTAHLPGTAVLPHTYIYSGHFTVSLTVQDTYTSNTEVKRGFIRVTEVVCTVYLPVILRD